MIFYVPWVWDNFAGMTIGPFIFILNKYKGDKGLVEHEKVHVRQFWRSLGLYGFFYLLSSKRRYKFELEAYRIQLDYSKDRIVSANIFVGYLTTRYRLTLDKDKVLQDLLK